VSNILPSYSSSNRIQAVALRDWLTANGWKDRVVLDLVSEGDVVYGPRWKRSRKEENHSCAAILFLVSKAWLTSVFCQEKLKLAQRLGNRLFAVLIEDVAVDELPVDLACSWQVIWLARGLDHPMIRDGLPASNGESRVAFSSEGLQTLKRELEEVELTPTNFEWPPEDDLNRSPYRGLRPFEAKDAGIFFGRDTLVTNALDRLRRLRDATPPRLLVILGEPGFGKSSFLRAGLLPRIARDHRNFLALPVIRPGRAAITGDTGLIAALEGLISAVGIKATHAELRAAVERGPSSLRFLLRTVLETAAPRGAEPVIRAESPTLIISIDQGEELFFSRRSRGGADPLCVIKRVVARGCAGGDCLVRHLLGGLRASAGRGIA